MLGRQLYDSFTRSYHTAACPTRINAHNKEIKSPQEIRKKSCNCQKSRQCPLEKDCQQQNVVYQATITAEKPLKKKTGNTQTYIGIASDIKARIANHEQTFKNES